jgi:hypothetical protein
MSSIGRDHSGLRLDAYRSPCTPERLIVEIRGVRTFVRHVTAIWTHYMALQAFGTL